MNWKFDNIIQMNFNTSERIGSIKTENEQQIL